MEVSPRPVLLSATEFMLLRPEEYEAGEYAQQDGASSSRGSVVRCLCYAHSTQAPMMRTIVATTRAAARPLPGPLPRGPGPLGGPVGAIGGLTYPMVLDRSGVPSIF